MVRSVEDSLKRMNTDYIDLYYLHMWDFRTPVDEILRAFDDLVRAGKVLYIGFVRYACLAGLAHAGDRRAARLEPILRPADLLQPDGAHGRARDDSHGGWRWVWACAPGRRSAAAC